MRPVSVLVKRLLLVLVPPIQDDVPSNKLLGSEVNAKVKASIVSALKKGVIKFVDIFIRYP
jgi:hypothetical protein